jgi:hypothetical protein
MEYLFSHGVEYKNEKEYKSTILPLYVSIIEENASNEENKEAKQLFYEFCMEIFFQNSRLLYDGIEKSGVNENKESGKGTSDDFAINSYFLKNMSDMREWDSKWAGVNPNNNNITAKEWILFEFLKKTGDNEKDTKIKYDEFIKKITNMVQAKYAYGKTLRVALLTQKGDDESNDMRNLEFITDNIQHEEHYKKSKAKYIIKKRIVWALGKKVYGDIRLIDDGYCIILPPDNAKDDEAEDFDFEGDSNAYRKPFFIIRFDNIPIKRNILLGREAQPIEKVYLYFSFDSQPVVPILVMRDILSYRNSIMRMLEKDFNSHLMHFDARKTGENTVLKHEKTVSHTSTSDDQLPKGIWKTNEELAPNEYEWLLFRNYVNTQIAKLFNRTLLLNSVNNNEHSNGDSSKSGPKLYLNKEVINKNNDFESPAKTFKNDLFNEESDRRLKLCKEIIEFFIDDNLDGNLFYSDTDKQKGFYNKEFLKCILYDIFLSCARFWHEDVHFLSRIRSLKNYQKEYEKLKKEYGGNPDYFKALNAANRKRCIIFMARKENSLVVINPVRITDNRIFENWEEKNKRNNMKIENPIDSFDGNMSLFTISNYIRENDNAPPTFKYSLFTDLDDDWKTIIKASKWDFLQIDESLWFISILPIFERKE